MSIKRARRFPAYKLLISGLATLMFMLQPFSGIVHALGTTHTVCAVVCDYASIADAVAGASDGDTLDVKTGTYIMTTNTVVNKQLSIVGQSGATITTSGGAQILTFTAAGSTFSGFTVNKTDKTSQNIIGVQGANTTISGNTFHGQFVLGENDVTRALEVSTTTGVNIANNSFTALRQPAYINDNTAGTITNNYVGGTKGWVVVANTNFTFNGNRWGTNVVDIAFIPGTPNNYPCAVLATIKANNNNANIDNQALVTPCPNPPATPTGLAFTNPAVCGGSTNNIHTTASWAAVPNAVKYNYRSWKVGDPTYGSEATAYVANDLSGTTRDGDFSIGEGTYYFEVQAVNAANETSAWSAASCAAVYDATAPAAPAITFPANNASASNPQHVDWMTITDTLSNPVTYIYQSSMSDLTGVDGSFVTPAYTSAPLSATTIPTPNTPEGTYYMHVQVVDAAGNKSAWGPVTTLTVDNTVPAIPTNGQPHNTYKQTNDFYFTWNSAGNDANPVKYEFQSSASSAVDSNGSLIGAWNSITNGNSEQNNLTSPQIHSTGAPDGKYYWQVRAYDAAGNKSAWSQVWNMTIDSVAPTVTLTSPTDNATVNGASLTQNWSSTSTDINHYVYESYNDAAMTSLRFTQNTGTNTSKTATNVGNATFWWRVKAVDNAGNETWSALRKLTVNNPVPAVNTENFNTHSGTDYQGLNVGFNIADFSSVSAVTVSLYQGTTLLVTNTHNQALLDLINGGVHQLSTPFIIQDGTYVEDYWNLGDHTWASSDQPDKTVITVTGKDVLGATVTKTAENTLLSENGTTFASLIPVTPAVVAPQTETAAPQVQGASTDTPGLGAGSVSTLASTLAVDNGTSDQIGDTTPVENDSVLGAETTAATDSSTPTSDDATTPTSGLAWYWWTLIAAAVVGLLWWIIAAMRRRSQNA